MPYQFNTKKRLLDLLDDIELVAKELLQNTAAPRHKKISPTEHALLVELLLTKDKEYREALELAEEQALIQQQIDEMQAKVDSLNPEIEKLYNGLKEGEQILAAAVFKGRQKLASIRQANKEPVSSEEIINYAHRITANYAVNAPMIWCKSNILRPYPTDVQMRQGSLGKLPEVPINIEQNNLDELDMRPSCSKVALETRSNKEASQDDLQMMSTDSSSD